MNRKKYFVALIALNAVLLAFAVSLDHQRRYQGSRGSDRSKSAAMTGLEGKFGPVLETVLPAAKAETSIDILDLETGCLLRQPPLEDFNSRPDALMAWIRSHGLDISCSPCQGRPACVTYDMAIVPVETKGWQKITERELLDNPALAPVSHSPRRLLVPCKDRFSTYIFRTGKGILGMLQLVGLTEHGVKIRYKLINPAKSGQR
jgi:hypothetical protein